MAKLFFEVFPTLKLGGEIQSLMSEVEVERVASNRDRNALRVYLTSNRLIEKAQILFIEGEIIKQLFPNKGITVKIMEKFNLSQQYTPQKLMDVYKTSILEELHNYSLLIYNQSPLYKIFFYYR